MRRTTLPIGQYDSARHVCPLLDQKVLVQVFTNLDLEYLITYRRCGTYRRYTKYYSTYILQRPVVPHMPATVMFPRCAMSILSPFYRTREYEQPDGPAGEYAHHQDKCLSRQSSIETAAAFEGFQYIANTSSNCLSVI